MSYEYKVVPAPVRGLKAKGLKTPADRFANALETAINELAAAGWEYIRADTLPSEQREGIMGKTTVFQNMLVFRREKKAAKADAPVRAEPQIKAPAPQAAAETEPPKPKTEAPAPATDSKKSPPDVAAE